MNKKYLALLAVVVVLGLVWFGSNRKGEVVNPPQENTPGSGERIAENPEGEADPNRMTLGMNKWTWISALYNDGREVKPGNNRFTLTFAPDGTFSASTDCNGMGGDYTAKDGMIAFRDMMSTLMYCEGSQESEFRKILENTSGYHFTSRGELILELKFDSGTATFR